MTRPTLNFVRCDKCRRWSVSTYSQMSLRCWNIMRGNCPGEMVAVETGLVLDAARAAHAIGGWRAVDGHTFEDA